MSGGIFVVNIFKHQHIPELFFSPFWETTAIGELRRVFIGTEQTIPQGDIREIVLVHVVLVMNGMKLGGLDKESKPFGRPDVGMVEVLARGAEEVVPESPHQGTPQQRIQHQRAENGVAQYLNGVLVERRQYFNARRRVMDLVKNQPESFRVPQPMPPVEEERADEPAHEPFRQRHVPGGQLEQRYVAEDLNPEPRGRQNNQQLRQIDP